MKSLPGQAVFVDPSGRRRTLARRVTLVLAVPALCYVALLASTMLGGPSPDTPLLPVPDAIKPPGSRTVIPPSEPTRTPSREPVVSTVGPTAGDESSATPDPVSERTPVSPSAPASSSATTPGTPTPAVPTTTPTTRPRPTQANATPTPGRDHSPTRPTRTKPAVGAAAPVS